MVETGENRRIVAKIKVITKLPNSEQSYKGKVQTHNYDEILANHRSFMTSLNIPSGKQSEDLPYLYWIPKLHKTPYKERYIAGSSTLFVMKRGKTHNSFLVFKYRLSHFIISIIFVCKT
jgi:hypothetical protein